jgi:hypothetical protein
MEAGCQKRVPAALPLGKGPNTQWTGGWVGSRASLEGCGKSCPPSPRGVFHEQYKFYIILQYAPPFSVLQQHFLQLIFTTGRQSSAVSIVTRQRSGEPKNMFQLPASRRVFSLLQSIQNGSEGPHSHTQWALQTLLTHFPSFPSQNTHLCLHFAATILSFQSTECDKWIL